MGHVEIKETAVQKAGRLAGIVAQCPQYPLNLTWWTDTETAMVVKRHYELVDATNKQGGCNTIVQALERAKIAVPETELPKVYPREARPILMFDNITQEERINFKNKNKNILGILQKYNPEAYETYKLYNIHCWKIDTPSKCEKYGLTTMTKPDAYSTVTNIREQDRTKNVLMVYLHENTLIFSAWNGQI